ncbi:chromosome partitioning protein ParB [Acinetobacter sp. ANC 3813]|uniref:chromosome partitioning protein ParB n=1 Tax=Acinetobacter sp. ANC 3813 TaxID=1977873 RepID=UPI000A348FDF|nr:chromosome partitioning protein ParB [Acinetobacter sp. ANC 3813]OTG88930.1 chromosome partitioning protein ParB [Acinetobacter sp. ANC 3813]
MTKNNLKNIVKDQAELVELKDLFLDPENPRLPSNVGRSQQEMLNYLAKYTSIEDLMNAIAENDYFAGEPLIAFKKDGKHFVVEGNRRLTALKLITDPHIISSPGNRILEISQNARHKPNIIPVITVSSREAAIPYLGYRHITGVKQWEPLAKARYIRSVLSTVNQELPINDRLKEVANIVGNRRDHIRRNLEALTVYEVIERNDFFGIESLNETNIKFAVLSTALSDERFGEFIGLESGSESAITEPDSLDRSRVKELTEWIYKKDKDGKSRLGESRNLKYLGAVISNNKAIEAFRRGTTLASAYRMTQFAGEDFLTYLYEAENLIMEATSLVATVDYTDDGFEAIRRINKNVKLIANTLKSKKMDEDDEF